MYGDNRIILEVIFLPASVALLLVLALVLLKAEPKTKACTQFIWEVIPGKKEWWRNGTEGREASQGCIDALSATKALVCDLEGRSEEPDEICLWTVWRGERAAPQLLQVAHAQVPSGSCSLSGARGQEVSPRAGGRVQLSSPPWHWFPHRSWRQKAKRVWRDAGEVPPHCSYRWPDLCSSASRSDETSIHYDDTNNSF